VFAQQASHPAAHVTGDTRAYVTSCCVRDVTADASERRSERPLVTQNFISRTGFLTLVGHHWGHHWESRDLLKRQRSKTRLFIFYCGHSSSSAQRNPGTISKLNSLLGKLDLFQSLLELPVMPLHPLPCRAQFDLKFYSRFIRRWGLIFNVISENLWKVIGSKKIGWKTSQTSSFRTGVSNTRPTGRMWPARAFCATRDVLWAFSNMQHLRLVYSPVFKSVRLASEQVSFERT